MTGDSSARMRGTEVDMRAIRDRFGGADLLAGILGMFAALGTLVFLGSLLLAGRASIGYQLNQIDFDGNLQEVEVVGAIVAIVVVLVSFFVGGWAAGRVARYDGGINGLGVALWFILLVAIFGALGLWFGQEYNAFAGVDLPNWFGQLGADDLTLKSVAGALAGMVAALLGGYIGGVTGEVYHRNVDAALVAEATDQDV
jgi:amino acid transporter